MKDQPLPDVIIVGAGADGGTLAHTLAPLGKRILLLKRGGFLTRELENWDLGPVFVGGRYISSDAWYDDDGTPFQPQVHYFVGGATRLYGAAPPSFAARTSPSEGDVPSKGPALGSGQKSRLGRAVADAPAGLPDSRKRERYRERSMSIGPVQLLVLGFSHPDFHGEIIAELERLRESDTVRVIDSLAVYKDAEGNLEVEHLSNLTQAEAIELGSKIGALIGLGIEGEEGAEAGAAAGAQEAAAEGIHMFGNAEEWDVIEDIPNDSAAALILLEHHWAVPLRDAIARAGGFRISDGFISPLDLVEIGLMSGAEAKELHEMETSGQAGPSAARDTRGGE